LLSCQYPRSTPVKNGRDRVKKKYLSACSFHEFIAHFLAHSDLTALTH
jgi:hypothetical protein